MRKRHVRVVILVVLCLFALLFLMYLFSIFDTADVIYEWSRAHEDWELDELILSLAVLCFAVWVGFFMTWRKNSDLNKRLSNQNNRLQESNDRLMHLSKLAAMGENSAEIIHEINQPISAIIMLTDIALDDIQKSTETDIHVSVQESLQQIYSQGKLAIELIQKMRDRVALNRLTSTLIDINELILDVLIELKRDQISGISIEKKLDSTLPKINVDPGGIRQVLINLIKNAMDAMRDTEKKQLTLCSYKRNGTLALEVTDSGCGISDNNLNHIFEPFFSTKQSHGMGLGLYISNTIIDLHSGHINVKSQLDSGSTFLITLPLEKVKPD